MQYKFFREETQELEDVDDREWKWEAYYSDGFYLKQYADDGIFHQFAEIDQDRLQAFTVTNGETRHTLLLPEEAKLIHFYRNTLLENAKFHVVTTVFGYEKEKLKVLFAIMPDGQVVITDDIAKIKIQLDGDGQ